MTIYQRKPPFPRRTRESDERLEAKVDALLRERGIEPAGVTDDPVQEITASG